MSAAAHQPETISTLRIDAICQAYVEAQAVADKAQAFADDAKAVLLNIVEQHGFVPKNAEQSRRLEGKEYVATITSGRTISIDEDHVTQLQLLLSKAGKPRLFNDLFSRTTKHTLKKNAAELIRAAKISGWRGGRALELFAMCFRVASKTPSLNVDTVASIAAREAKSAAKAAKKSPKKAKG
ncbi:hypothetical protein Acid345_3385 [Candidatus Koribacter versatilis Ellin345]|uniref:Uncharacterized protein n=1 Tax=Koribacter versatilis (strain Ellin345) TaxID=204669 RepID=Q1IL64_KORVE|nr:hypothetical protein [Candidatus Koribacter versatilis]ABF42386.1 hypothetical protein Acid345_3385 [Candidatus Koribacter versatilis Ellin345]